MAGLSKEMLSWKPMRMVTAICKAHHEAPACSTATRELSTLDTIFGEKYISVLLFYEYGNAHTQDAQEGADNAKTAPVPGAPAPPHVDEPVTRLHLALQELLIHYPCAAGLLVHNETNGRLEVRYPTYGAGNDDSSVYGVQFHVAHANLALSDLGDVSNPHPSLDLLYPSKPTQANHTQQRPLPPYIMALQVTTFKCGGFCLAHTCSHAYADGYSEAAFLQNLCSIARGVGLSNPPDMLQSRRVVFRAREPPIVTPAMGLHKVIPTRKPTEAPAPDHLYYGNATRFVFTLDALDALRARVSKPGQLKVCSRNQALMAVLWTAHARVRLLVHAVPGSQEMPLRFPFNLRSRGTLNLTAGYVGNALFLCTVYATLKELCESPLADVVEKITKTIGSLDFAEYTQSLIDYLELQLGDGRIPFMQGLRMPSFVGLPFYDTDCGWGSPIYVGRPSQQLSDRCIVLEHPAAQSWNVLTVFRSPEEHACFQECVAEYTHPN